MSDSFQLTVLVPVYNSAKTLNELIQRIDGTLMARKLRYQVVFVNDGSSDDSWKILRQIHKMYNNITIINLKKNYGQHNALICGFRHAQGEYVVTIDDDLQYPPEEIINLYDAAIAQPETEVIFGIPQNRKASLMKRVGSYFCYQFIYRKGGNSKNIRAGSFRIIKKNIVEDLIANTSPSPVVGAQLLVLSDKVRNIKVKHNERTVGRSNYRFIGTVNIFANLVTSYCKSKANIVRNVYLNAGIIFLILYGLSSCYNKMLQVGVFVQLFLSILSAGLCVLLALSVLIFFKYCQRLMQRTSRAPQYIIDQVIC